MEGSNPGETCISTLDFSSGYHQCKSRDIFPIILPQGIYRYTVLPQGAGPSSNLFKILTDAGIRGKQGNFKNIDDILIIATNADKLEEKSRKYSKFAETRRRGMIGP